MKMTVLCVGKVKEKFYRDALDEFTKRLSKYCKVYFYEVQDEKTPDNASHAEEMQIMDKEASRLEKGMDERAYVIALAIQGKKMSSTDLADKITEITNNGYSHIQFVIGGSLGLSKEVLDRADFLLSFSDMTFPHQLMRVILTEQIYRSFRIINNEPYHK